MKNKLIVTTGYMGSGSSAVTDLLAEYENVNCSNGCFEYVFLHCPNGLFDLEDKLLIGNNALRSDEALHSFKKTMHALYINNGNWTSNYRKFLSPDFEKMYLDFVRELSPYCLEDVYWYYQQNPENIRMKLQLLLGKILRKLSRGKIALPTPLSYKDMMVAYPSKEEFYEASRNFLDAVFGKMGIEEQNIVLDQLLLPHNLNRIDDYFDDNLRVIVVDRDPRDVYLLNKYVWTRTGQIIPYSMDAAVFCDMYRKIRENAKCSDKRILKIHFEDLVYNYQSTVRKITKFIGLDEEAHVHQQQNFDPRKSINNTQLFVRNIFSDDGIPMIEERLGAYCYPFDSSLPDFDDSKLIF